MACGKASSNAHLTGRQKQDQRLAAAIAGGMEFGNQGALRATDTTAGAVKIIKRGVARWDFREPDHPCMPRG